MISFELSDVLSCDGVVNWKALSPLPVSVGAVVTGVGVVVTGVGVVVMGVRQSCSHCCKVLKLFMIPSGSQLNE